ncbi:MAG: molybdopterin molybdotransferase MoeA [Methanoregulaceae archaeon]|jgi:molybdopterin molybdotransferase|nr:molybdopterin molybdotransferase MoeA [Methanoregulaceae archaeon]
MSLFLTTVSVEDAVRTARSLAVPLPPEEIPLSSVSGRILAADIRADIDIPGFNRSSVDGYAVRSRDTAGASESLPALLRLTGRVAMGEAGYRNLLPDNCFYVPTGGAVPEGADAMVMVEYTESIGEDILVKKPAAHGDNIVLQGEDFKAGSVILLAGTLLSPREIAALAATGKTTVPVVTRPRVGVISTGNELIPVGDVPRGNQVRDINSWMCGAFLKEKGCIPEYYGITGDDRAHLRGVLHKALSFCDAVLISGGSSKDDRDMTADLIRESGEVLVHGIALAPGKPTIIGRANGIPVIGLPGHPASAFVVLLVIARPLLYRMTGQNDQELLTMRLVLGENIPSTRGREDYVRVCIREGKVYPEFGKSGLVNTLIRSDGLVKVPSGMEGLEEGDIVEVILW